MNRLLAHIKPRLLLAEGLALVAAGQLLGAIARAAAAWEVSWVQRLQHAGLADAAGRVITSTRSPKP
jgi:hypothetical protein